MADTFVQSANYKTASEMLKLLAHPGRLRILDALRREAQCVCHLEALLQKPQPYVSQQLRVLREGGIICDEKDGLNIYYCICDLRVRAWLGAILGPVEPARAGERHQRVADCTCPKCGELTPSVELVLIALRRVLLFLLIYMQIIAYTRPRQKVRHECE